MIVIFLDMEVADAVRNIPFPQSYAVLFVKVTLLHFLTLIPLLHNLTLFSLIVVFLEFYNTC